MVAASSSGDLVISSIDIVKNYAKKIYDGTRCGKSDQVNKKIDRIRRLNLDEESIAYLKQELLSIFRFSSVVNNKYPDMKYDELISLYDELNTKSSKNNENNENINSSNVTKIISKSLISNDIVKINGCLDYLNTKFHSFSEKIFNYSHIENKIFVIFNLTKKNNLNDLIIENYR